MSEKMDKKALKIDVTDVKGFLLRTFEEHAWAGWVALIDEAQVLQQGAQEKVVGDCRGKLLDGQAASTGHQQLTAVISIWRWTHGKSNNEDYNKKNKNSTEKWLHWNFVVQTRSWKDENTSKLP